MHAPTPYWGIFLVLSVIATLAFGFEQLLLAASVF